MYTDEYYMKRALSLAAQGRGHTAPNPMVGAVLVKGNQIIGEGYHQVYGGPHAEAMALDAATRSPVGATMYCSLEPCTPDIPGKKTPPCSIRLLEEGIRNLVIASLDPHPQVNGRGIEMLRQNGVTVKTGCLAAEAIRLNEVYMKFCQTALPFVHLKWASSLDGRIATLSGDSRWISDKSARREVHELRHAYDAVLVGADTAIHDNPRLTVRHISGRQPYRIIVDTHLRIPTSLNVLQDEYAHKTVVFCSEEADSTKRQQLLNNGIQVLTVNTDDNHRVNLNAILRILPSLGIRSLLVEGGSAVLTAFVKQKLFDKVSVYIAPTIIGNGIAAIGNLQIENMQDRLNLENTTIRTLNQQVVLEGYHHCQETFGIMTEHLTCLQES